eukprot:TRINITY_DN1780_c0_g1_i3.p4 TRINITY_DN1780_c0_g1~~TRINITY_DN1780_c0_g1_i3.p4  ORF type:complete len:105 (+),score=24.02 TRINITY_DN1780_c0_g1_i3:1380-1694(+)
MDKLGASKWLIRATNPPTARLIARGEKRHSLVIRDWTREDAPDRRERTFKGKQQRVKLTEAEFPRSWAALEKARVEAANAESSRKRGESETHSQTTPSPKNQKI